MAVKCGQRFGHDLGETCEVDKQQATFEDIVVGFVFTLTVILNKIVKIELWYSPLLGLNVRRAAVDERAPFILHERGPSESSTQTLFPCWDGPIAAVYMQTELFSYGHELA